MVAGRAQMAARRAAAMKRKKKTGTKKPMPPPKDFPPKVKDPLDKGIPPGGRRPNRGRRKKKR